MNNIDQIKFAALFATRIQQLAEQIARLDDEHSCEPRFTWTFDAEDPETIELIITTFNIHIPW